MAVFVKHEACPQCGSRDNLGRYSDGSAWCFGCHYTESISRSEHLHSVVQLKDDNVQLSDDLCNDFPRHVVEWLGRYDVSVGEAIKWGWKYSPGRDQLVFIFYDKEKNIACVQARNFRQGAKTKYYNQGSPAEVLPICSSPKLDKPHRTLVVVEDAVSAARIARQCDAMPCLGSYLPARKLMALKVLNYETLLVWLDSDKLKEAREIEDMAKWVGLSARTIYTELDPKEYNDTDISNFLK